MRKKICIIFFLMVSIITASNGQNPILRVAVSHYQPPFVMQGANNYYFGYDIAMMEQVCALIQYDCKYIPMRFDQLLPTIEANKADIAVSGITITTQRLRRVNFSTPYLPSESRFIAHNTLTKTPFGLQQLDNKRIGVQAGSIFADQIRIMGIKNPTIIPYQHENEMINALSAGKIDLILMDAPAVLYWQGYSSNILKAYGQHFPYGLGFGVVLNRTNINLLNEINRALVQYKASNLYKTNYQMYIEEF